LGEIIDDVIRILQQDAHFATPSAISNVKIRDKDDLMILSSALNGNADLLVTGDNELLSLGKMHDMEIVSPRDFGNGCEPNHRLYSTRDRGRRLFRINFRKIQLTTRLSISIPFQLAA